MIKDQRGSMTAYVAMIFLVFLLFISLCVEGVYSYVGKGKAVGAYMTSLSHAKGNYQKELEEDYHIFAMDPRYKDDLTGDLQEKIKVSLEESQDGFRFQVGDVTLAKPVAITDQQGELLKYQIRELMKYQMTADLISSWTKRFTDTKNGGDSISKAQEEMDKDEEQAKKEEEKDNQKEPEKEPTKSKKDPRKGLMSLLNEGSIYLVMGKSKVSNLSLNVNYGKVDKSKDKTWNFMKKADTNKEMDALKEQVSKDNLSSEMPGILYSLKYFHNLTSKEKKKGLQYEVEYLIAGKDSEKENLGSVFWKMIGLRFVTNLPYVYQSATLKNEARLLATSVLGITGIPPLVAVAKHLLLVALAYGESVIDVRSLAEGKKVPLVKNKSTWQMKFANLAGLNAKQKPVSKGLSYEDYLGLLLIMQGDKRQKYMRMMDVMEQNIQLKVPDFQLSQCLASYQVQSEIHLQRLGFGGMTLPFPAKQTWNLKRITSY